MQFFRNGNRNLTLHPRKDFQELSSFSEEGSFYLQAYISRLDSTSDKREATGSNPVACTFTRIAKWIKATTF